MARGSHVQYWGAGLTVMSSASWVMVTRGPTPPLNRVTDTTENITFPQLRWQAINKYGISQDVSLCTIIIEINWPN